MKYHPKLRRLYPLLRKHSMMAVSLLTVYIILLLLNKEINYSWFSFKFDVELYQNRITIWSSDYHIRYRLIEEATSDNLKCPKSH
jgi:hypothetical protein